ncbi:MAG: hypothetical protein ACYDBJ_11675 [Aggregatilineales bacterium]
MISERWRDRLWLSGIRPVENWLPTIPDMIHEMPHFERHVARLLIALYHAGSPTQNLWDGETRQVDSIGQLQQFEFWLREPGHLALALLSVATEQPSQADAIRPALGQLLIDDSIDRRRVIWPGAPFQALPELNESLTFLSSRALVSDRPSFGAGSGPRSAHQIVLETAGIELARRIIETCPLFGWYDVLGQMTAQFWRWLGTFNLLTMPYLPRDVTASQVAVAPLLPLIQARYVALTPIPAAT